MLVLGGFVSHAWESSLALDPRELQVLPDSVLRFFLLGVSPRQVGGAKGRGQDESSCDPVA